MFSTSNIIYGSTGHVGMPGPRGFTISEYNAFIRKGKINKIFPKIGRKSLETGYVFAPYILQTTATIIMDGGTKSYLRRRKIDRLFNIGFEITGSNTFIPKKSLMNRYATNKVNNKYYTTIANNFLDI